MTQNSVRFWEKSRESDRPTSPDFWPGELERRLNRFGTSACDLPELDPESCQTEKQYQHAMRVRARFLARRIHEIERSSESEEADRLFGGLMTRAALIDDGPAWFVLERKARRTRRWTRRTECNNQCNLSAARTASM